MSETLLKQRLANLASIGSLSGDVKQPWTKILPKKFWFFRNLALSSSPQMQRSACSQRSPCSDWKQAHAHDQEHAEHRETVGTGLPGSYYLLLILNTAQWSCWLTSQWFSPHFSLPCCHTLFLLALSTFYPSKSRKLQSLCLSLSCWRNGSLRTIFTQQQKEQICLTRIQLIQLIPGPSQTLWSPSQTISWGHMVALQSAWIQPTTEMVIL